MLQSRRKRTLAAGRLQCWNLRSGWSQGEAFRMRNGAPLAPLSRL